MTNKIHVQLFLLIFVLCIVFCIFKFIMAHNLPTQKTHVYKDAKNPSSDWDDDEPRLKSAKIKGKTPRLEYTTDVSPISSTAGTIQQCAHTHSYMKASHPIMFIRFPYRPSLMTLLRQAIGQPIDSIGNSYTLQDPVKVYASFQNHWNPAVDLPVLTIVGACNTNISPPILTRKSYEYADITVMASTSMCQEIFYFKIPLIQNLLSSNHRIVMQTTSSMDVADQLTTYVIHPQNPKEPIALIKLWNLSAYGCQHLHLHALYEAPRAKVTDELHLLGLSGTRDTTYHIELPDISSPMVSLLEELDLQALGYRQKASKRPLFPPSDYAEASDKTDHLLIARSVPQQSTYRHPMSKNHVVVPDRNIYYRGSIPHKPFFYPPPLKHKPGFPFGTIKPVLFPAGFHTSKTLIADKLLTVKDIINDMSMDTKTPSKAINTFAECFDVSPGMVETYLNHTFEYFFNNQIESRPPKQTPYFVRPPIQMIMPTEWIHSTKHPAVSAMSNKVIVTKEGEMISFPLGSDDCTESMRTYDVQPDDTFDIDLLPDDVIDPDFWFPKSAEDNNFVTTIEVHNEPSTSKKGANVHDSANIPNSANESKKRPVPAPRAKGTNEQSPVVVSGSMVAIDMSKLVNAQPFVPSSQRATKQKITELVKSPPPGYITVSDVKMPIPPVSPTVPTQLLDTGNTSPASPCECPPSTSQGAAINYDKIKDSDLRGKFEKAAIQGVIRADTEIVDSIKMILARHGL